MRRLTAATALLAAAGASPASAQHVFEVSGGGSSLFDAYGAAVNYWGSRQDGWLGIGWSDGLRIGAFARAYPGRDTVRAGNDVLGVRIPTDLFTSSPSILFQGAGYARARGQTRLRAHVGASAIGLNSPYFAAARGSYPMVLVEAADTILARAAVSLTAVGAKRQTVLGGFRYALADSAEAAIGGGVGANRPYAAVSGTVTRPWVRVRASYAYRAPGFRRAEVSMPNQVETERENVEVVFRAGDSFQFGVERKHYVQDSLGTAIPRRSAGNAAFAMGQAYGLRVNGGVYFAEADGLQSINSYGALGRRLFPWLDVDSYYLHSQGEGRTPTYSVITHLREQVTHRVRLVQQVSYDGRSTRVNFGGNLLTGIAEVNADYQVYYLPLQTGSPFRTVFSVQARLQLGKYATSFGTTILPDGTVGYNASGSTFLYHGGTNMAAASPIRIQFDRFIVRGVVVDDAGRPVEGAAIALGPDLVFTDARGEFFHRTSTLAPLPLGVSLDDFLLAGFWVVESAPATVGPTREEDARPVRIVLRRQAPPTPAPPAAAPDSLPPTPIRG